MRGVSFSLAQYFSKSEHLLHCCIPLYYAVHAKWCTAQPRGCTQMNIPYVYAPRVHWKWERNRMFHRCWIQLWNSSCSWDMVPHRLHYIRHVKSNSSKIHIKSSIESPIGHVCDKKIAVCTIKCYMCKDAYFYEL